MDLAIELAKGTLQYAPSYIATLVQFLTGPVKFLLEVLRSPEKGEELGRVLINAFCKSGSSFTLSLAALMGTLQNTGESPG
jgi:hypothetical protein